MSAAISYNHAKLPFQVFPSQETVCSQTGGIELDMVATSLKNCLFSQTISGPQQNYCVTRKELLAVVRAIQWFSMYLYGQQFTVCIKLQAP